MNAGVKRGLPAKLVSAYKWIIPQPKAIGFSCPVSRVLHPDSGTALDTRFGNRLGIGDEQSTASQVFAVELESDPHRSAEPAWPVGSDSGSDSFQGFQRANQDCRSHSLRPADHVQAVIHSIDEI